MVEMGEAQGDMAVLAAGATWNITTQHLPTILQKITCHFGTTEVDIAVPPFEQCEILMTNQAWGHIWTREANDTFWESSGKFWWGMATAKVQFEWQTKNTSCWPEDFNRTLGDLAVDNFNLKSQNSGLLSSLEGEVTEHQRCEENLAQCEEDAEDKVEQVRGQYQQDLDACTVARDDAWGNVTKLEEAQKAHKMATHAGDEALSARVGELEAALKRSTSTIDSMRVQMTTLE